MPDPGDRQRLRVLLLAELCNPDWVSAPLVGWSHARALADLTDAHLVTHVRNRESIARAGLVEGEDFTVVDTSRVDDPLGLVSTALGVPPGANRSWTVHAVRSTLAYYYFERLVWARLGPRIRAGQFDVVHRLTPLSPATPSTLSRRCARVGIPFVLGPLNGGVPWPRGFRGTQMREREWLSHVRDLQRLLPGHRATRRNASAILVGSRTAYGELDPGYAGKIVYIPENAVDPARFDRKVERPGGLPLRVVFVGRLVPVKGADLLLKAAAPLARSGKLRLEFIGEGPEKPALRSLAEREAIIDAVEFTGWVEHRRLQERLIHSDVLGFLSVREFGGAVVLEAMATGLPAIVLDFGGPAELVSPATGFAVPMGSAEDVVRGARSVLEGLVAEPSVAREMGERARRRVLRTFTWPAKAAQTVEVYRWVLGRREKPDFGMPISDDP